MDPRGLAELVPDFAQAAPLDTPVTDDAAYFLTRERAWKLPITPPPLRNHGNYVVSINKLVKWLGGLVEQAGVNVFTQFAGAELIYEGDGIAGVITEDKGRDRDGKPKDNFTPGYELRAKVTVLAEGPRGSLTKDLVARKKLDGLNPQLYSIGVKELWEVPEGRIAPGCVAHTLGWPLDSSMYGGGWIYGLRDNRVSLGLVTGLEYHNPRFDPHEAFQEFKTHPFVRPILEGGKLVRYGAKTVPVGGWYSMPRTYVDGGLIIGDSASFLNSQRLKGIHLAIKTRHARRRNDLRSAARRRRLSPHARRISAQSRTELDRQGTARRAQFPPRRFSTDCGAAWRTRRCSIVTGGRGLVDPMRMPAGYTEYHKLDGAGPAPPRMRGDGVLTFDRLTDVFYSGTRHEEDQPVPPARRRHQHLRGPLRHRIRQSLPIFLSRGGLRNDRGERRAAAEDQRLELRALQDLRHRRPLPDHHLGAAGRRRRAQLRRHVTKVCNVGM